MEIEKYVAKKGLDVSRKKQIQAKHVFVEPNNLYSLRKFADFESLDFIYSKNLINETKFHMILIKEWLNFCKVKGHIIIEMNSNKLLDFEQLVKEAKLFIRNKAKIVVKEKTSRGGILVIKKTKPLLKKGDTIDKWTFGIVADGRRNQEVTEMIDSIKAMKIPHFEVIICGIYNGKYLGKMKNLTYLEFDPPCAWITKKKNMIAKKAKYENLVIVHDRFVFDKNWHKGMKKYGNYFEALSCVIKDLKGQRVDDWLTFGTENDEDIIGNLGLLDYRDWDINGYIGGGYYILKKSVWRKCPWDNKITIWGGAEDLKISRDFYNKGFVARFNPFAECITITNRGKWFKFKLRKKRFIKMSDRSFPRRVKNLVRRIILKRKSKKK